ncbi:hypothetical protein F6Q07_07145 [Pectobacterium parmentieri]|uniref:hypothetical protein n=1 Tax=Pectobacterium parmentieri TaxID=1905730 RepID=UPI000EAE85AC|nr:hypothetical protein [Pectobacterium parmentieri]AYH03677.1 hypothetical protein C5E26_23540 [Pectobacterium parmentieri]AYH29934.1 hypothetical protein C5E20_23885 [Pectobacterium parmentieri]AYH34354.1 hypothetical protein C5E19_23520 [Pectobacterium parmentieri]MBI0517909.1 hypothetical protein [Pectobacterium parmentieri]
MAALDVYMNGYRVGAVGFARESLESILTEFAQFMGTVVMNVRNQLPAGFLATIRDAIQARARRLTAGWE